MRGRIEQVQEYIIQCGRCPDKSDDLHTARPQVVARQRGWSKRQAFGWICPECVTATEAERDALKAAHAKPRGFGSPAFSAARQREIASKGGTTAQTTGRGRKWTPEQAREAGRKGGLATARNRSNNDL